MVEAREQVGAQGGNHLLAARLPSQHDHAHTGPDPESSPASRQVLGHRCLGIGQDDIHGAIANAAQRLDGARAAVISCSRNRALGDERAGELVVVADQKNTTHDDGCRPSNCVPSAGAPGATPGASARDISLEAPPRKRLRRSRHPSV